MQGDSLTNGGLRPNGFNDLFKKPSMMKPANDGCRLCWAIHGRNVVLVEASSVTFSDGLALGRPNRKVSAAKEAIK